MGPPPWPPPVVDVGGGVGLMVPGALLGAIVGSVVGALLGAVVGSTEGAAEGAAEGVGSTARAASQIGLGQTREGANGPAKLHRAPHGVTLPERQLPWESL